MSTDKNTHVGNNWEYTITVYVGDSGISYRRFWRYA